MSKILVIDDERSIRDSLKDILKFENYEVAVAEDGLKGIYMAKKNVFDLVLCDIKMPEMDGIEVLDQLHVLAPDTPVVMISGHGDIDTAVESIKKGAYDFIEKPLDLNRLLIAIKNATDKSSLISETKVLKKKVSEKYQIIGHSPALIKAVEMADKVAPTEARVLIMGENGSGKELFARRLYERSNRSSAPFVEVNCAAIPSELIESELFGHEKGAFTSALKQRKGKFEIADKGTLFLDEIGDMSLSAQSKVLRALQDEKITRVGGDHYIKVDVRVIAATNKNLIEEIHKGNFREDLYHRLSVIIIPVPSLNQRLEDIPELTSYFINQICGEYGMPLKTFTSDAVDKLKEFHWTGNIREFRNVIERLIILCDKNITVKDVEDYAVPLQ